MKKFKILIIDNENLILTNLNELFKFNFEVLVANNLDDSFSLLNNETKIDCILINIKLAILNNFEYFSFKNTRNYLTSIPTIVIGNDIENDKELKLLELKTADFIKLPLQKDYILQRVSNILDFKEAINNLNAIQFDKITKLYNLETFMFKVDNELKYNIDEYYLVVAKIVNYQTYSEIYGMQVCNEIVEYVSNKLREIDDIMIMAHSNGDSFAFVIERNDTLIFDIMEQINSSIMDYQDYNINLQYGISNISDSAQDTINCCKQALLNIESDYNESFSFFDENLKFKYLEEKNVYLEIEKAIKQKQISVLFQEKVDLITRETVGYEIFSRWNHDILGLIYPHFYVPILDKYNKILTLDKFVWEEAAKAISILNIPVSANISQSEIYSLEFKPFLIGLVNKYQISPNLFHIEITESNFVGNRNYFVSTLNELRDYGFVIEMDDFGTSISGLKGLSCVPLDIVKIDMKFLTDKNQLAIVKFIIDLAHKLNLKVVANGVSDLYLANTLKEFGCDFGQGYYFGRSITKAELMKESNYGDD